MKQVAQAIKDGGIQVLDVPAPALQPHGVLVRNSWSLISAGTERAKVALGQKGLLGKARSRPDQVVQVLDRIRREGVLRTYRTVKTRLEEAGPIGYSCAGVVTAVGELAEGLKVGDRVACGGGGYANHAEMVYVPGTLAVTVPDHVGLDEAAFTTVGAVALQGVRQSGAGLGDRVAVIGLGLLGLLTVQLLRAAGCEVAGMDPDASRCKLAAKFGAGKVTHADPDTAERALLASTGGRGFDAVILTAATRDSGPVRLAGGLSRDRGTVVVVGDVGMDIPRSPFYEKEIAVKLSRSYGPGRYDPAYEEAALDYPYGYVRWTEQRNMAEFVRLLAARQLDVKSLITHHFPVQEAAQAYALLGRSDGEALGVLLEYPQAVSAPDTAEPIWLHARSSAALAKGKVGISLLGAGNFATATLLPALKADRRFQPRGVYTASGLSARDVAARNHFAFCAGSPKEILTDSDTSAVIISTRHASHAALTQEALLAGKTVFVEKPLALSEKELAAVVKTQKQTDVRLTVGFNRRFAPLTRAVIQRLAGRSSPATVLIRVNAGPVAPDHWTQLLEVGGGRILGEVCHFVDLAACLVGKHPTSVYAASAAPGKSAALTDDISVTLTFPDGSVATIVYTASGDTTYPKERVEVFCEGQVLVIDDFRTLTVVGGRRSHPRKLSRADKGHVSEIRAFLDLAQGAEPEILTFADCVVSTAATLKVIESLTTGAPVKVPQVRIEK